MPVLVRTKFLCLKPFLCVTLKSVSASIGGLQYTRNVFIVASET